MLLQIRIEFEIQIRPGPGPCLLRVHSERASSKRNTKSKRPPGTVSRRAKGLAYCSRYCALLLVCLSAQEVFCCSKHKSTRLHQMLKTGRGLQAATAARREVVLESEVESVNGQERSGHRQSKDWASVKSDRGQNSLYLIL